MNTSASSLTILFEAPFWIGLYERESNGRYEVCKITFGAEPKDYEVYDFLLKNWSALKFSPSVEMAATVEKHEPIEKALFVSPVVDMERLIVDMIGWAGVNEELLQAKGEIPTNFGQTLSWQYLCWVREHPLSGWSTPTAILYAGQDNLTSQQTIAGFSQTHHASLEVYEPGEHWFHTPEQLKVLRDWEIRNI